jgi:hypothetical protein
MRQNSVVRGRNTRQGSNFHQSLSNLSLYRRGTYHMDLKIFNRLPANIKDISHNNKKFKLLLNNFLQTNCFYTLREYF